MRDRVAFLMAFPRRWWTTKIGLTSLGCWPSDQPDICRRRARNGRCYIFCVIVNFKSGIASYVSQSIPNPWNTKGRNSRMIHIVCRCLSLPACMMFRSLPLLRNDCCSLHLIASEVVCDLVHIPNLGEYLPDLGAETGTGKTGLRQ